MRELSFVLGRNLLLGSWLLQAGIGAGGKLVLELLNTASRIEELQLTGEERMASRTNVDAQILAGTARNERIATAARNRGLVILGVNARLHGRTYIPKTTSQIDMPKVCTAEQASHLAKRPPQHCTSYEQDRQCRTRPMPGNPKFYPARIPLARASPPRSPTISTP